MSRGGCFGHSMSSRSIRTSLCITGALCKAWGCEREQRAGTTAEGGAGAPRSGDATPRRDVARTMRSSASLPLPDPACAGPSADAPARPPRSGDATVRESLAAAGKDHAWCGNTIIPYGEAAQRHSGGDRRIDSSRRQHGARILFAISEAVKK